MTAAMGAHLARRYLGDASVEPDPLRMPTFPPDYGFPERKERGEAQCAGAAGGSGAPVREPLNLGVLSAGLRHCALCLGSALTSARRNSEDVRDLARVWRRCRQRARFEQKAWGARE